MLGGFFCQIKSLCRQYRFQSHLYLWFECRRLGEVPDIMAIKYRRREIPGLQLHLEEFTGNLYKLWNQTKP